jgi:hypothetical protein
MRTRLEAGGSRVLYARGAMPCVGERLEMKGFTQRGVPPLREQARKPLLGEQYVYA